METNIITTPNPAPNIVGHSTPVTGTGTAVAVPVAFDVAIGFTVPLAFGVAVAVPEQIQSVSEEQLGFLQKPLLQNSPDPQFALLPQVPPHEFGASVAAAELHL